jgi:YggT family protein
MWILIQAIVIYRYIILAAVIASWVAPGSNHPIVRVLDKLTEPVFAPLRKVIPPVGGFDLTPLIVLFALSALLRVL